MANAEQQRRYRERKRQGLVVPRGRALTKPEERAQLYEKLREQERSEDLARFLALLERVRRACDDADARGVVEEAIEEVKGW